MDISLEVSTAADSLVLPSASGADTVIEASCALNIPSSDSSAIIPVSCFAQQTSTLISDVLPSQGFTLVNLDLDQLQLDPAQQLDHTRQPTEQLTEQLSHIQQLECTQQLCQNQQLSHTQQLSQRMSQTQQLGHTQQPSQQLSLTQQVGHTQQVTQRLSQTQQLGHTQQQSQQLSQIQQLGHTQQHRDDGAGESDDIDDGGVNIVVKGLWWLCKDCNIKQKFGLGENIEEHIKKKHNIGSKTKELGIHNYTHKTSSDQRRQASAKEFCESYLDVSTYAISSHRATIQDQGVDSLFMFDDTTSLQAFSKHADNGVLFSQSNPKTAENETISYSLNSMKGSASVELSCPEVSVNCSLSGPGTQLQPIPVIPALPRALQSPPFSSPPDLSHTPVCDKDLTEEITTNESLTLENNRAFLVSENIESNMTESSKKVPLNAKPKSQLDSKMYDRSDSRSVITVNEADQINLKSSNKVTIKQTQKFEKDIDGFELKECSVQLRRLDSRKHNLFIDGNKCLNKSKSEPQPLSTTAKRTTQKTVPVPLKTNHSALKSGKGSKCVRGIVQQGTKTRPGKYGTNVQSLTDTDSSKKCMSPETGARRSSGRKIRIPTRYLTGSEKEEATEKTKHSSNVQKQTNQTAANSKVINPIIDQKKNASPQKRKLSCVGHVELEGKDALSASASKKTKNENFSCPECNRKFRFENKLRKHMKFYAGQTIQQCTECEAKLHNRDLLNAHMFHMHLTQESTSCLTCDKILGSKKSLLDHLLTHPGTEGQTIANLIQDSCAVHQCTVCDEILINADGRVEKHYLTHAKANYTCQKCGQFFHHKRELYDHLKTHERPVKTSHQKVGHIKPTNEKPNKEEDSFCGLPEPVTDIESVELQNGDNNTDETLIAESVQQIIKYEESTSKSADTQMMLTLISKDTEKSEIRDKKFSPLTYCELCKKQFTSKKLLYQHLKIHSSPSTASNSAAHKDGSGASDEKELVCQPIDLATGIPFGIPCTLVKVELPEGVEDFVVKIFTTTPEGLVVPNHMQYGCALCEREFETETKTRHHVNRFRKQRNIVQCNLCSLRFHNLDLFNVHYTYVHQPSGMATCMTCKMDYNNKGDFLTHLGNSPITHPLSHKLGFKTFIQDACGSVTCSICQKNMWNYPMNIANHTKMHRSLSCPICQQEMSYKYALLVHLQVHANSKRLRSLSEMEQKKVEQIEKLHSIVTEVESNTFTETSEKFYCSFCDGQVLCTRKNIHQHLDLHARRLLHRVRKGCYFCPDCGEDVAGTDQSIGEHFSSHGQSEIVFTCIFCSLTFSSFEQFKEHEEKKHWLNTYFEKNMCEVCGKGFVSRQQFLKHLKLHEERQGLFSCPQCKQAFRFESQLQKHMAKHNGGSYVCQYCGKQYMTKLSLGRHEQVDHIGIKNLRHKCKYCDAQFINATLLRDHVTNKHTCGTNYTCEQCGLGFKYLSTLARHRRVEHDADTPYVCQDCGARFPLKKELKRHMISHTGVNPLQCPACSKSFGLERTMKEHYDFFHQGIQKFVCPNCGNKFPRERSLKRHMGTCKMSNSVALQVG